MRIRINDESITYVKGIDGIVGPDEVLLDRDDNLIAGAPWEPEGWTIAPFLAPADWDRLRDGLTTLVRELIAESRGVIDEGFRIERYHDCVAARESLHKSVATIVGRGLPDRRFPIPMRRVIERVEAICGCLLHAVEPGSDGPMFNLRIVRPRSNDNNPLHRDVWLDRLRNAVNIYVPLAGSDERSSLALVPGSHHWKESEIARTEAGAVIDNVRYTVPSVVGASRALHAIRPNPGPNQVLVFSPYLIHGGASNGNLDRTRVSLEMRFWRRRP